MSFSMLRKHAAQCKTVCTFCTRVAQNCGLPLWFLFEAENHTLSLIENARN